MLEAYIKSEFEITDTKLSQIPYTYVEPWEDELRKNKQWKKLAMKMKLNYEIVKDLGQY